MKTKGKLKELEDACIALDAALDAALAAATGDDDFDVAAAYNDYVYDANCDAFGAVAIEAAAYGDAACDYAIEAAAAAMSSVYAAMSSVYDAMDSATAQNRDNDNVGTNILSAAQALALARAPGSCDRIAPRLEMARLIMKSKID